MKGNVTGGQAGGSLVLGNTTQNNRVFVVGDVKFSNNSNLIGGNLEKTGNSLYTQNANGMTVGTIANFENYFFDIAAEDALDDNFKVYNITGTAVDLTDTNGVITIDGLDDDIANIGQFTLFTKSKELNSEDWVVNAGDGHLVEHIFDVSLLDNGNTVVTQQGSKSAEQSILEGQAQIAGLQMVNIAADFSRSISSLYKTAFNSMMFAQQNAASDGAYASFDTCSSISSPVLFAGVRGGTSKWSSDHGSKTNVDYISLLTGFGWRYNNLLLSAYFESGWGNYDAKLHGRKFVDGENTNYVGGGLFARYEQNNVYGELNFHAGRVKTDFKSNMLGTNNNLRGSYDTSNTYVGIDVTAGYKINYGCSIFDLSAGYSWNHVRGEDFNLLVNGNNSRINQDNVNSHRVRAGGEWSYNMASFAPYAGAYFEYEFDGKSKNSLGGWNRDLVQASTKGATGIGELGVRFTNATGRFMADVGVEGYVGKRQGVTGKAAVAVSF